MARILVCDRCGTQQGVLSNETPLDACHPCAMFLLAHKPGEVPLAIAKSATPSDDDLARQRRNALFMQHQADIYEITPAVQIDVFPQTMKYGAPGEEVSVQVLGSVPGKAGKYFAKMVS